MSKKPETLFKEKVLKKIRTIPRSWFEKIAQVSSVGTPDIIGCVNGMFVAIELKVGNNKVSDIQAYKLAKISSANGMAFVMYPENFQEIYDKLLKISQLSL